MPFPIIPILTAIPSILSAYKTVKSLDTDVSKVNVPKDAKNITKGDMNVFKRATAVELLTPFLLDKIVKRGGDADDIGTLVDFACFIYKMVRGKKK